MFALISLDAAALLPIIAGIVGLCFYGLLGVAAWKIVTGKFQGPKNCPHCGVTLRA
jgi:hypothetical protein